ncbi:hypothetical protein AB4251_10995 [Vibrio lentus]|uniref:hypothetical protein n=1 Tax=Vibrio TaxID=662 RepID=UPI000C8427AD|nr:MULTISPECIES: hypothetical protein [Vibrio]CAH7260402.1 conserved hypothetical protein [Vibrio chagasii]NOI41065.1 hypothetical protein [Vibrio sp. 070316B]PMH26755.1 hypothetical protein BCU71_21595 [Vibrio lentus]CAH7293648.1 conserved hypothetical protein [Vibrio chagasii]CAH7455001.1 conserved hypothetical protein [Vibrio chagasii]
MQIIYGYCDGCDAISLLGRFVEQGDFIAVKQLGPVGGEHVAFAALLSNSMRFSLPFDWNGAHFVAVQKQTQSVNCHTSSNSINARKKRYRKVNNIIVTPKNWRQHVSRNRGLKYASESLSSLAS